MKGLLYCIQCVNDPELFWNNDWGWVDSEGGIDTFTEKEMKTLNLPIEGEWVDYYMV